MSTELGFPNGQPHVDAFKFFLSGEDQTAMPRRNVYDELMHCLLLAKFSPENAKMFILENWKGESKTA